MDPCGFGNLFSLFQIYSVCFSSVFLLSFNDAPCKALSFVCVTCEWGEEGVVSSPLRKQSCQPWNKGLCSSCPMQGLTFALSLFWKRNIIIEISWSKIRHQRVHPTHLHGFALVLTETHGMWCFCFSTLDFLPFFFPLFFFIQLVQFSIHLVNIGSTYSGTFTSFVCCSPAPWKLFWLRPMSCLGKGDGGGCSERYLNVISGLWLCNLCRPHLRTKPPGPPMRTCPGLIPNPVLHLQS